jgi:hypothetical protein
VLDLAAVCGHERPPDDQVVLREEDHERRLPDRLQDRCRTLQVREQDRPERVDRRGVTAGLAHPPEKPQDVVLRDADDL